MDLTEDEIKIYRDLEIEIPDTISKVATYNPHEEQLLIEKIETENFKSYFGKQIIGPFHQSFTAVIGPNGSGKSNVIDSMLFVFGFRASKIRSKKLSVLIHNSSQHSDINFCTVIVFFKKTVQKNLNNESENSPPENIEFNISRTAFKDNSSYYSINGKKSNYREISDLLKSHGIDLDHNRFLILQGEVEMISLMKPKAAHENEDGMLEFLEDIIGSNRYQPAINKISVALESESEKRTNKLTRFKACENELKSLEPARNKALQYLKTENKCISLRHTLLQHQEHTTKRQITIREKELATANTELNNIHLSITTADKEKKELETQHKTTNRDFQTATKTFETCQQKLNDLDLQDAKIRETYKHNQQKLQTLTNSISNDEKKIIEWTDTLERNDEYLQSHEGRSQNLKDTKSRLESELEKALKTLKENTKHATQAKEKEEKILMEQIEPQYIEAKSNLERAKTEHKMLVDMLEEKRNKVKSIGDQISQVAKQKSSIQENLKNLTTKDLPELEKQAETLRSSIEKLASDEKRLKSQLTQHRKEMQDVNVKLRALSSNLSSANNNDLNSNNDRDTEIAQNSAGGEELFYQNMLRNQVVKSLMQAQRNGKINGILGRIGDLGIIPSKYDVAVSSACGSALDNILVMDENCAQNAINFLKRQKLPPSTFVCANQLAPGPIQNTATNATSQRLYDLVKFLVAPSKSPPNKGSKLPLSIGDAISAAFYYAMRETLVSPDLEQATALAYSGRKRNRVVTLQGHLIEVSGTLSGGGNKQIRGKMSSKFYVKCEHSTNQIIYPYISEAPNSKSEDLNESKERLMREREEKQMVEYQNRLKQLENECEMVLQRLTTCQNEKNNVELTFRKLNNEQLTQLKLNRESWTMEIETLELQLKALENQLEEFKEHEKAAIGAKTNKKDSEETKMEKRIEILATEITNLQNIHDEKIQKSNISKAEIEKYDNQIKSVTDKLIKPIQTKLDKNNAEMDKLEKEYNKLKHETESLRKNFEKCKTKLAKDKEESGNAEKTIKDCKDQMKQMEIEATALMENLDKYKEKMLETKANLDLITQKIDMVERNETELKSKAQKIKLDTKTMQDVLDNYKRDAHRITGELAKLKLNEISSVFERLTKHKSSNSPSKSRKSIKKKSHNSKKKTEIKKRVDDQENDDELMESSSDNEKMEEQNTSNESQSSTTDNDEGDEEIAITELKFLSELELASLDIDRLKQELKTAQTHLAKITQPDLNALQEYTDKEKVYINQAKELEEVTQHKKIMQDLFNKLKHERLSQFLKGFGFITVKLKEIYRMITLGGDADLELVDSLDPFTEGVAYKVRPLNKSWKNVSNLSGGEKTLSSIALIFALHHYKPTPFYIMDEIDAALDFKNVSIVAHYIKQRTQTAQFIIISLRNNMFELANRLVGIYKTHDCTKNVVLQLNAPKNIIQET